MYRRTTKRLLDVILSVLALITLLPLLIAIFGALFLTGSRPFFVHPRVGLGGRRFGLIKFRSMTDRRDSQGALLSDIDRLTPIGKVLRSTSLDELPQLLNVLLGHMSLVGPRPLPEKYLPLYSKDQSRRHLVRPGITGLAQVKGRNEISWTKKFKYDIFYVDNISFLLDLKIIIVTIGKVLKREGINQSASRPMMPFNGYN